jgi:hypothetical protein
MKYLKVGWMADWGTNCCRRLKLPVLRAVELFGYEWERGSDAEAGGSVSYSFRAVSPIKVAWSVSPLTWNWREDELIFMKCDTEIYN